MLNLVNRFLNLIILACLLLCFLWLFSCFIVITVNLPIYITLLIIFDLNLQNYLIYMFFLFFNRLTYCLLRLQEFYQIFCLLSSFNWNTLGIIYLQKINGHHHILCLNHIYLNIFRFLLFDPYLQVFQYGYGCSRN